MRMCMRMTSKTNLQDWFQTYLKNIQDAWMTVPEELRDKFRGKITSILGEALAIQGLIENGFKDKIEELRFGRSSYDLKVNGKKVEVKACNMDNTWIKRETFIKQTRSGASRIKPSKFDILLFVEFNDAVDRNYFLFTSDEAKQFPLMSREVGWYAKKYATDKENRFLQIPFKTANVRDSNETELRRLNSLVHKGKDAWKKI